MAALAGCQTETCPPGAIDSIFCRGVRDGAVDACVEGAQCSPQDDLCADGVMRCGSAPFCEVTGRLAEGAPCGGGGYTCAADGSCSVCAAGAVCNTGNPCVTGHIDCGSGTPVCVGDTPLEGAPCGTSGVCGSSACSECIEGSVCNTGNPCTSGHARCVDETTTVCEPDSDVPRGVTCGDGLSCSGTGACDVCSAGAVCNTGNPCTTGHIDCGSGDPVCVPTDDVMPGTGCGSTGVCSGAGECSECIAGSVCNTGNPCTTGTVACAGDVSTCAVSADLPAGVRCGEGLACDGAGSCSACVPGDTCVTASCRTGTIDCSSGDPVCIASGVAPVGAICRERVDACDVAEVCDGTGAPCPPDRFAPDGTACLDRGTCDGGGNCIPFCVPGSPCDTGNACEVGTTDCSTGVPVCVGGGPVLAGTECRAAVDGCDVAEVCDGTALTCPTDDFAAAGLTCPSGVCNGMGGCVACSPGAPCSTGVACEVGLFDCSSGVPVCIPNGPALAGTLCRASAGPCDIAESCDGASTSCPADDFDDTRVCRAAAHSCDAPETCDGAGPTCPGDVPAAPGTPCPLGVCDPMAMCRPCADGTPCSTGRDCEIGQIDCSGGTAVCVLVGLASAGTECRAPIGLCDAAEVCTGASPDCPDDVMQVAGTACRAPVGSCDVAEVCDGMASTCPADVVIAGGTECRAVSGLCDVADFCDGVSGLCPPNAVLPAITVCRPPADICDAEERCTGLDPMCPPDAMEPTTTVCRAGVDACDAAERCAGAPACPPDVPAPLGTSCPTGVCDGAGGCDRCDAICPARPNATPTCDMVCGYLCDPNFGDCNGAAVDGCEIATDTHLDHCGGCGMPCPTPANSTRTCTSSTCGFVCDGGFDDCDGAAANGCEISLSTDPLHCGGCGSACPVPANATATCSGSTCGFTCNVGFADCNGLASDGCERPVSADVSNCGGCGVVCPTVANSTRTCVAGSCGFVCTGSFGDCNGVPGDGCETDTMSSVAHCSGCGAACPARANATVSCTAGACGFTCNPGWEDCNGVAADGCEARLLTDPLNCDGCGNVCPTRPSSSPTCLSGTCGINCDPGFGDCNSNPNDGCEVNLTNNVANCGSCGAGCALANASEVCVSSSCAVAACDAGWFNVDGVHPNGCECLDGGHNSCGSATSVGSLGIGGSTERTGRIVSAGEDWYVVSFPPAGNYGGGSPRVQLVGGTSDYRFDVFSGCGGGSFGCGGSLDDFQFTDNQSNLAPPFPQGYTTVPRSNPWPSTVYVRVTRITGGLICSDYTLRFAR